MNSKEHHISHRKRLRERFKESGVADYELLEMLLFLAKPRGDTKPIAKNLIKRFQNLNGVFWAQPERLKEIEGVGDSSVHVMRLIQKIMENVLSERILRKPILSAWHQVVEYLRIVMGTHPEEHFRVLFLDNKNRLIADEIQQRGTINQASVYPREVIRRALDLGASAVIMAHNHPSGDPTPSKQDIEVTMLIKEAGQRLGISLYDHIIIGRYEHRSLKSMGVL